LSIEFGPLSESERRILDALFSADFPGKRELMEQANELTARPLDAEGSLALRAKPGTPAATVERRIPVEAEVEDADGVVVHVLLHVVDGFLDELEIFREDSGPLQRPIDPEALRLIVL
jgi:hypothetical protein